MKKRAWRWRGLRRCFEKLVGARGFEPPTPCSQSRCATRPRYTPPRRGQQAPRPPDSLLSNAFFRGLTAGAARWEDGLPLVDLARGHDELEHRAVRPQSQRSCSLRHRAARGQLVVVFDLVQTGELE